MAASIVYVRALQKAADIIGDRRKLARHLRVSHAQLERWMGADEIPNTEAFLKAIEIILDETGGSGPGETPPSRSASATCASVDPGDSADRATDA
jgi:hypothetical protein